MMLNAVAPSPEEVSRLEATMKQQLRGTVHHLRLDLREEGLVIVGQAHSYYAKQLAQSYVMDHAGLDLASNEIIVSRPQPN